ncbi:MAG: type II toxin-antitoxin system HicA family toxin [Oscillospiraceae bacterium]|nr:type II toxin-antitoxin system HicA family toxin [Oscillospiraceae bacterium]
MTWAELERKLKKDGWKREEGKKHAYMIHDEKSGKLMISRHPTQEVPTGTMIQILKDAGLK